ncbi:MAG: RDD family protein, partial [Longimicrobiales bacterium]|nr:RDD family protein [Longimicrobiales bacterium]
MTASTHRDPRSVITPDAFEVAEDLIGVPLASPRRRAVALVIDAVLIGLITAVTKSFSLILGVVAAAFFVRAGFKRTKVRNSVFGRAMRLSVGCLGIVIAIATASLWFVFGPSFGRGGAPDARETVSAVATSVESVLMGVEALGFVDDLASAQSIEEAETTGRALVTLARERGWSEGGVREALLAMMPEDQAWGSEWPGVVDRLLADDEQLEGLEREVETTDDIESRVAALTESEAFTTYALLAQDDVSDPAWISALEARLGPILASDTMGALQARSDQLAQQLQAVEHDLREAEAELEESSSGGLFGWVRARLDELGFGFGWAAIYMSVFLSWWNGQTIGKRMMGVRVVRLDGEAITWWTAFERAGGYAAGFATGLLGFAQIWWDSNRQAIQDRIVGTVVV